MHLFASYMLLYDLDNVVVFDHLDIFYDFLYIFYHIREYVILYKENNIIDCLLLGNMSFHTFYNSCRIY